MLLATVKGDVHDIGKNIVGVVLGCNGYEVVDLGVMVHADRILQAAIDNGRGCRRALGPDHAVARRDGVRRPGDAAAAFTVPLLIGGATTSPQHTAVKIAPEYAGSTVHVLDASRAAGVVATLLDRRRREDFDAREPAGAGGAAREVRRPARAAAAHLRGGARQPAGRSSASEADVPDARPSSAAARSRCRWTTGAVHRLDVLLPRLGAEGQGAADLRAPGVREAPRASCSTTRRRCSRASCATAA